jgi:hypothetical protein
MDYAVERFEADRLGLPHSIQFPRLRRRPDCAGGEIEVPQSSSGQPRRLFEPGFHCLSRDDGPAPLKHRDQDLRQHLQPGSVIRQPGGAFPCK